MATEEVKRIRAYFEENNLEEFLVTMLVDLGMQAPSDPIAFMKQYIASHQEHNDSDDEASSEAESVEDQTHLKSQSYRRLSRYIHQQSASMLDFVSNWADDQSLETFLNVGKVRVVKRSNSFSSNSTSDPNMLGNLEEFLRWDMDALNTPEPVLIRSVCNTVECLGVLERYQVTSKSMKGFVRTICENYNRNNPFHNFHHAASVMLCTALLLRAGGSEYCEAIDEYALLIAALSHDVGHPGFSNDYFVKKQHDLAIRYNDIAVLENMHASLMFEIINMENNKIVKTLEEADYRQFRKTAVAAILATDMKIHFELISKLKDLHNKTEKLAAGSMINDKASRELIQIVLVHGGDLSNPVIPTKLYQDWAYRVSLEFYNQAQAEQAAGLPFAPYMQYHPDNRLELAKLQIGFISFVVRPFWETLNDIFDGSLNDRMEQLEVNLEYWKNEKDASETSNTRQKDASEDSTMRQKDAIEGSTTRQKDASEDSMSRS